MSQFNIKDLASLGQDETKTNRGHQSAGRTATKLPLTQQLRITGKS